jgi:hypothetical protein
MLLHARDGQIIGEYDHDGMRSLISRGGLMDDDYWCSAKAVQAPGGTDYHFQDDDCWNRADDSPSPLNRLKFEPVKCPPDADSVLHTACIKLVMMRMAMALMEREWSKRVRSRMGSTILGPRNRLTEDTCMAAVMAFWGRYPEMMQIKISGLEFTKHAELATPTKLGEALMILLERTIPHIFETESVGHLKFASGVNVADVYASRSVKPIPR